MEDALEQISQLAGLAPKDAVIGRALIRNNLIDAQAVLTAAHAIVGDSRAGLLDRLIDDGHLDSLRAAQIERALEKKLAERMEAQAGQLNSGDPAGDYLPEPVKEPSTRWQTPTGKGPRMWIPRQPHPSGDSTTILFNELKNRRAERRDDLVARLADAETARTELELRIGNMEKLASEAARHKAKCEAMKAMMETVSADAQRAKAEASFKEQFIEQLMQEFVSEDGKRKELEARQTKLKRENERLKGRLAKTPVPKKATAKKPKRAAKKKRSSTK